MFSYLLNNIPLFKRTGLRREKHRFRNNNRGQIKEVLPLFKRSADINNSNLDQFSEKRSVLNNAENGLFSEHQNDNTHLKHWVLNTMSPFEV